MRHDGGCRVKDMSSKVVWEEAAAAVCLAGRGAVNS